MKVLVTGAGGQLGRALQVLAPREHEVRVVGRAELDIGDAAAVRSLVRSFAPELVINAAAYTQVDAAEKDPAAAYRSNAEGPDNVAAALEELGARLIHVSTDFVFDGEARTPYRPSDTPNPIGVYGDSKLEGERRILRRLESHALVVRTAWLYASSGRNFLLTMLRLMREKGAVRVVADQTGTPTAVRSLARALWRAAASSEVGGVHHWTDAGQATWYEFAAAIAREAEALQLLRQPVTVTPITTADYPTAARRPAYSVLDCRSLSGALDLAQEPWPDALRATLREVAGG